jgi:outer membrane protein OmpA-like peptidoglycan-associated protein
LTADADGGISLCEDEVKKETSYTVDVKLDGYIGKSGYFSTVGLTESTTFAREFFLKEVILEEEYPMPLVLYPFNQAELLIDSEVNSEDSLNYLVDLMEVNETFVIQLESHTDTRGEAKYNRELSQRRAQTCVDYLISKGIAADRLVARGRGEDEPLVTDKEIAAMKSEDDKEAAHQMNRRTVFKIIRFDYVPKQ